MATLAPTKISRTGAALAAGQAAASAGGDKFPSTGAEFVIFTNGSGGSITVTIPIQATVDGQAVSSRTVAVAASATVIIGPFPPGTFNDAQGNTNFTYSSNTSLTVGVFVLGN